VATSWTEVVNLALIDIGADRITSLDDDSNRASLGATLYPQARDEVLRAHPWNSATARARLAALATAPAFGFAKQYQLPADCLRVLRVNDADAEDQWKVEGRVLLCDLGAPLDILYVQRVADPSQLDPLLVSAIAAQLAMRLARALYQSDTMAENARRLYERRLQEARSMDGQEGGGDRIVADYFVRARY
jgi:hypothetical protein